MKKKTKIIIASVVSSVLLLLMLLTPVISYKDDGGTVEYIALLYKYTDYNGKNATISKDYTLSKDQIYKGGELKILGFEIFNSAELVTEAITFECKVIEVYSDNSCLVEVSGEAKNEVGCDKALLSVKEISDERKIKAGDEISVTFDGTVMETYPAQINALRVTLKK